MKLFRIENGKEVVYVQMQDIMHLNDTDIAIPASIFTKVFTGVVIVDDRNRFNFVKFDEEHEVKFFRELEFILDYGYYKDFTDEQLEAEGEKFATRANEIANKWNSMTEDERRQNSNLIQEYENLDYMMIFLSEIYAIKHGKRQILFPELVESPKKTKKRKFFRKKDVK